MQSRLCGESCLLERANDQATVTHPDQHAVIPIHPNKPIRHHHPFRSRQSLQDSFQFVAIFPRRLQANCGKSSRYCSATSTTISSSDFISIPKTSRTFSRSANPTFDFFAAWSEKIPFSKAPLKDTRAMPKMSSHTMSESHHLFSWVSDIGRDFEGYG